MQHSYTPSTTPGAIIGYRKSGAPIRLIAGGSPEGEGGDGGTSSTGQEGGSAGTGQQDNSNTGGGQGGGQQQSNGGNASGTGGGGGAGATDETPKVIAALRDDYKAERTKRQALEKDLADLKKANDDRTATEAERAKALAKFLGIEVDETPDPEKLAADLKAAQAQVQDATTKAQARERELTIELQLMRQAAKHGANPELLADSKAFAAKVAKLDPTSDSFAEDLGDAIKAAVADNPAYKLTPPAAPAGGTSGSGGDGKTANGAKTTAPPARSGGEHNGAAGGNRQWTMADVDALPKTREGGEALQEAIEAGLLQDLGYAPPRTRR
jgi:hypothetical protein